MRVAFSRTSSSDDSDDTEDSEEDDAPGDGDSSQDTATPTSKPKKLDVIGLDEGYRVVALSRSGDDENASTVVEILLARDEATIRDLAAGEWHPIVVEQAPTTP